MIALIQGNASEIPLADESVQVVVTSPPYWGLRKYAGDLARIWGGDPKCSHKWESNKRKIQTGGKSEKQQSNRGVDGSGWIAEDSTCRRCGAWYGELGLEPTPEQYTANILGIFQEVKRVLRPDGSLWLVIGDSFAGSNCGSHDHRPAGASISKNDNKYLGQKPGLPKGLKPKDICGIPWRVAFALQEDGWWLRMDNVWFKTNPMPESVKDRPSKSHEYIFLFSKEYFYYYDYKAILEPAKYDGRKDKQFKGAKKYRNSGQTFAARGHHRWPQKIYPDNYKDHSGYYKKDGTPLFHVNEDGIPARNKRSVWVIPTSPYQGAHFATFPPRLAEICIKAGSPEGGIVFDPFIGSGTTLVVARALGRHGIGLDLSNEYTHLARKRLELDKLDAWTRGCGIDDTPQEHKHKNMRVPRQPQSFHVDRVNDEPTEDLPLFKELE